MADSKVRPARCEAEIDLLDHISDLDTALMCGHVLPRDVLMHPVSVRTRLQQIEFMHARIENDTNRNAVVRSEAEAAGYQRAVREIAGWYERMADEHFADNPEFRLRLYELALKIRTEFGDGSKGGD